jgi:hypothetical protein
MEYWSYIFSSFGALLFILFKKRRIDLFTILMLCTFYYSSPLLNGILYDTDMHKIIKISPKIYWFYTFLYGAMIYAANKFDKIDHLFISKNIYNHSYLQFYLFMTSLIFLILVTIDWSFFLQQEAYEKSAKQFGPLWAAFTASILTFLSLAKNSSYKSYIVTALFFLLTTLIAGSRAYFAAGAIVFIICTYKSSLPIRIASNISVLLKITFGFLFLFFWKSAYPFILAGQFMEAHQTITDPVAIGFRLFKGSEAGLCMLNFHHAIDYFETSPGSFFELIVVKLIPFLSSEFASGFNLNGSSFSDILNIKYYQTVTYGMGSNLWGSIYYVSGSLGLILFVALFLWLVFILNKLIKINDLWSHHLVGPSTFLCFYGTRIEVANIAYFFYVNITMFVFCIIMVSLIKHKHYRKSTTHFGSTKLGLQ